MRNDIIKTLCNDKKIQSILLRKLEYTMHKPLRDDFDFIVDNTTDLEFYAYYHHKFSLTPSYKHLEKTKAEYQKQVYEKKFATIKSLVDITNKSVIDIGQEDCYYSKLFRQNSADMSAINIQLSMGYTCDKSCIKIYDGHNVPYKDNMFDVALLHMVLHHVIDNSQALLTDIHRILKPGGTLVIEDHDFTDQTTNDLIDVYHFLYELVEAKKFNTDYYNNYTIRRFTKEELLKSLSAIGFVNPKFQHGKLNKYYFVIRKG